MSASTPDGAVTFIHHDENDVLLWMTGEQKEPFSSTLKLWNACIDKLAKRGHVIRAGPFPQEIEVTEAGEAYARELRADA